jgi:TPR repeat protein
MDDRERIGIPVDFALAVQKYELSSNGSAAGSARYGWLLYAGKGVPVDFTVAAEFFKRASDSNDADGTNNFGCCLERGDGVDKDIERAVWYYRKAASQSHPRGLYNFARCLEYGKGIDQDINSAAKYYHLSAELNDADAQNSFGICLERGIGVQSNLALAAHYYQQSALQGHPDGANNLGFCLEHGRGVEQDIRLAAEYYKSASDCGHPECGLNYRRCLRLLGRWDPPDCSSQVSVRPPSNDRLAGLFVECLKEPQALSGASTELITSIERLKASMPAETKLQMRTANWNTESQLGRGDSSVVTLARSPEGTLLSVKTAETSRTHELIKRETVIHKKLKHPLILEFRGINSGGLGESTIVTAVAGN